MTGTKTAPRSSSTPAISSPAFSPVAYSKMNNTMKYNAIQQRINSLTTIYENLKETTYNMDNTIMNMWKNWADDNDNKFNTYLINYTLDIHNSRMNERLKRIDNLYDHIYQLEKEQEEIKYKLNIIFNYHKAELIKSHREASTYELKKVIEYFNYRDEDEKDLTLIEAIGQDDKIIKRKYKLYYKSYVWVFTEEELKEEEEEEEEESEDEQEYHPRLFGKTEEKPQTREEEEEEEEKPQTREELEKILNVKVDEYNEIIDLRYYISHTLLGERIHYQTDDGIKNIREYMDDIEIRLEKLRGPIRGIHKKIDQILKEKEEEESKEEEEEESEEEEEEEEILFESWQKIFNDNEAQWYDTRFSTIYAMINLELKREIKRYHLVDSEYTYNELMDFYDDIKNVMSNKKINYALRTLYKDFVLKAVSFTIFINYYKECLQFVIKWENHCNIMVENLKEHIETQINRIDEIFYVLDSMGADGLPYKPFLKNCHKMNMINITNYNKL